MKSALVDKSKTPNWLLNSAGSFALTAILLVTIENLRPNFVAPFFNYRWLLWGTGILVLIALIVAGFDRKSVPGKPVTGQSKNTESRPS